jgi:hypothetical protein
MTYLEAGASAVIPLVEAGFGREHGPAREDYRRRRPGGRVDQDRVARPQRGSRRASPYPPEGQAGDAGPGQGSRTSSGWGTAGSPTSPAAGSTGAAPSARQGTGRRSPKPIERTRPWSPGVTSPSRPRPA